MKLGLFGGSFNPPHTGHLIVIESVRDQLQLDTVLFVPSAKTPNKHEPSFAAGHDRLRMTNLAVEHNPHFRVSDIELQRGGISYTIDTINQLAAQYPHAELHLIIGADNFLELQTWKAPEEILAKAALVVMHRPGFLPQQVRPEYVRSATMVHVPPIGISGTDIRLRIKTGRSIRYLVPSNVEEFIRSRGLYRD